MIGRTNTGGGGGGGLNFQVVGGTTAPSNPKENMIWINTDQKITSYIFSATEHSNPVEGMVWISTGTSSTIEFNALKKNGIQVYPISTKQYIGGAWVVVTAMSYQNGEWVAWMRHLYNKGDQCTDITGGWISKLNTGGTATFNDDSIMLSYKGSSGRHATIYTKNKIDLVDVSALVIVVECTDFPSSSSSWLSFAISETNTSYELPGVATSNADGTGIHVITLDVSDYTGKYYVGFRSMYATSIVTEIYMV